MKRTTKLNCPVCKSKTQFRFKFLLFLLGYTVYLCDSCKLYALEFSEEGIRPIMREVKKNG